MLASPDKYTPCAPRPSAQWAWRATNARNISQHDILQQLSASITSHEYRLLTLALSFGIDLESHDKLSFTGETPGHIDEIPPCSASSEHSNSQQKSSSLPELRPHRRPGRLSPTVLQMIMSPNISVFSEASSGADTSYDSGLYRWLGVREPPVLESSPRPPKFSKLSSDIDGFNLNTSAVSSESAYSQQSPLSSPRSHIFPLSPPATVRPTFTESLCSDSTEVNNFNGHELDFHDSAQIFGSSSRESGGLGSTDFYDFEAPLILKNLSLQHYAPSAIVLRRFQRVIDELRGKYVPNDLGNNVPKWERRHSKKKPTKPPSLRNSRDLALLSGEIVEAPLKSEHDELRITQELYAEMAGMLFEQVERDEAQVMKLRHLADRLETLAKNRRKTAVIVGMRGRGNTG